MFLMWCQNNFKLSALERQCHMSSQNADKPINSQLHLDAPCIFFGAVLNAFDNLLL